MNTFTIEPTASFDELRRAGREAQLAGRAEDALALSNAALAHAKASGSRVDIDLAMCSRCSAAITLGDYREARGPLRQILMRRSCVESAFLAADNLSRSYELTKEFKKGLFYARVARDHALASGDPIWRASTHNQSGNCLLGDSFFEEAAAEYEQALALVHDDRFAFYQAAIQLNLGYCLSVLNDHRRAFQLAFASLRQFRQAKSDHYCAWAHLDLCHAYVQVERPGRARRHGHRALELAERTDDRDLLKNTLFMLGEAERLAGDTAAAYTCFSRLQRTFYPDQPELGDVMLAFELRQIVNLRA